MAEALCTHWRKVFSKKGINKELLVKWFELLRDSRAAETSLPVDHKLPDKGDAMGGTRLPRRALPRNPAAWTPRRKDMVKALRLSGNSSPGPDGIPFSAWRQLGELGVYTLHEVATALRAEDSVTQLQAAYQDECEDNGHDYNLSTLVCLPKAPAGDDLEFGQYFNPSDTRPLSIVNCDNRIVASAARWRWEENMNGFIKSRQQGFLQRRSILRNLLEIDNNMLALSCTEEDSAAIFLDFAAAFPSIDQEFVMATLKEYGVPEEEINFIKTLYDSSSCKIALLGGKYDGFPLKAGVRQGCPLSPLVYALVAELLMDRIEAEFDDVLVRAYADDTALALRHFSRDSPRLATLFEEFAQISGLHLNMKKSVIIPLNLATEKTFRVRRNRTTPKWRDMPIRDHCKYLGFYVGPGKGSKSWEGPFKKFCDRLSLWGKMPLGLNWDARIYNMFLIPTLGYIAQLESPPAWVVQGIRDRLHLSAKGPAGWASCDDLWQLQEAFGLKVSFKKIDLLAQAAQSRVFYFDRACSSKTGLRKDHQAIRTLIERTEFCLNRAT
jgi:hypothetical protein